MSLLFSRRAFLLSLPPAALVLAGCKQANRLARKTKAGLTIVRVGYIGITCEAPIFTAIEMGFFREEGLEVAHLLRNARLRNAESIRGPTEAARLRDGEEVAQVPNGERIMRHREKLSIARRRLPCKTFEVKMRVL